MKGNMMSEKHEQVKPVTNDALALSVVEDPRKSTRQLVKKLPFSVK